MLSSFPERYRTPLPLQLQGDFTTVLPHSFIHPYSCAMLSTTTDSPTRRLSLSRRCFSSLAAVLRPDSARSFSSAAASGIGHCPNPARRSWLATLMSHPHGLTSGRSTPDIISAIRLLSPIDKNSTSAWRTFSLRVAATAARTSSTTTTSPSSAHRTGSHPKSERSWRPACGAVQKAELAARAMSCSGLK